MASQEDIREAWEAFERILPTPDVWSTTMLRHDAKSGPGAIVIQVADIGRYDWLRLYSHIQRLLILADKGETCRMTEPERAV